MLPGTWGAVAFAAWPEGVVAFDPSTGEPLGPMMASWPTGTPSPSVSETPDATLAVVTWADESLHTETAVFDISTGEILVRGLPGLENSHVLKRTSWSGSQRTSRARYDLDTFKPVSTLARATGGSKSISVSADGRTLLNVGFNHSLTLYDLTARHRTCRPAPGPVAMGFSGRIPHRRRRDASLGGVSRGHPSPGICVPAEQALKSCALAGRELTAAEWSTYFPGEEQVATCAELAD